MIVSKIINFKDLYKIFVFLSLILFFFSTAKVQGKAFDINKIEISRPYNFLKKTYLSYLNFLD